MTTFSYYKFTGNEVFFYDLRGNIVFQEAVHMRTAKIYDFDRCIEQHDNAIVKRDESETVDVKKHSEEKFDRNIDTLVDGRIGTYGFPYYTSEENSSQEIMKKFTTQNDVYRWFLIKYVAMKRKLEIETDWNISFDGSDNSYIICESIETFLDFERKSLKRPIIPLLDTILHIHKEFYCCTLEQIAIRINGKYSEKFSDKGHLMAFVFAHYKNELIKICKEEMVPIHEIYLCNFHFTFKHSNSVIEKSFFPEISQGRRYINVCIRPRSYVDGHTKSYGDIPYLITSNKEDSSSTSFCFGPILIRDICKCKEKFRNHDDEHFYCLDIYPGVEFEGIKYPPFYMGFKFVEDDKRDFVCRGKIFDELTVREQLILRDTYNGKVTHPNFATYRNPDNFCLNFRLSDKENTVRNNFMIFLSSQILGTQSN